MNDDRINIIFKHNCKDVPFDLDIPVYISVNELLIAFNAIFNLEIDINNVDKYYIKSENPINLLHGEKTIKEYGLHNGSILYF